MPAAAMDLLIEQGATWTKKLLFRIQGSNTPVYDQTWQVRGQIRSYREAPGDPLYEWSNANTNASIDSSGVLTLTVAAATSAAWTWDAADYDLEIYKGADVHRALKGRVFIDQETTR